MNQFVKGSQLVRVPVNSVSLGMYIAKLDRPWVGTPFMYQGFRINDNKDLRALREYCQEVYVDVVKSRPAPLQEQEQDSLANVKKVKYQSTIDVRQEMGSANSGYSQSLKQVNSMLEEVEKGDDLDVAIARGSVKTCTDSIVRNPNAMVWLTHIKQKDYVTAQHCLRVALLAISLGRHLGLPKQNLETLGLCGMLHDVGKSKISVELLNKKGTLTSKEFNILKSHAILGHTMLAKDKLLPAQVLDAALSHHERIDGQGYPNQVSASNLSFYTRIVSIVDAYDAMISERPYKKAMTSSQALKTIYDERGRQFDHHLVVKFIESMGLYPPGSLVEMSSGEVGVVIAAEASARLKPTVALLTDSNKNPTKEVIVNLKKQRDVRKPLSVKQVLLDGSYGIDVNDYTLRIAEGQGGTTSKLGKIFAWG